MPKCLASPFRQALLSYAHTHSQSVISGGRAVCVLAISRRRKRTGCATFSTSVQTNDAPCPPYSQTLTVLHKITALLPRILPSRAHASSDSESLEFWTELLASAHDLSSLTSERVDGQVRIVVYGCDEYSGARQLVSALLEDPFASEAQKELIRTRGKRTEENRPAHVTSIQHVNVALEDGDILNVESSWLQRFDVPTRITELPPVASPSDGNIKSLFSADIPIIVCNPATTPLSSLCLPPSNPRLPFNHPHAIFILTSTTNSPVLTAHVKSQFSQTTSVLFVEPGRALRALETLSENPTSSSVVQRYQYDFEESNIASLTAAVSDIVSSSSTQSASSAVAVLRARIAKYLICSALSMCRMQLVRAEREVDTTRAETKALDSQIADVLAKVELEVFGSGETDQVRVATERAGKELKPVLDRLTWWRLPWRIDEVSDTLESALDRVWCKDLEKNLIFHAGRLRSTQKSFTDTSAYLLASFQPPSPFYSPVLRNKLAQITASPVYPLVAAAFTTPLHERRRQLTYPTLRLHVEAQRIVLGMGGSILGGLTFAWASWVGQLGLFEFGMQPETTCGVGLLGAVAGIRWAAGRWERAKTKWWRDWNRVSEGLDRSLKNAVAKTMEDQIVRVAQQASVGLTELATKRIDEIAALKEEVTSLEEAAK